MNPKKIEKRTKRRCRSKHRKCWILGGLWLWCYECGAITANAQSNHKKRALWVYPVGPKSDNPAVADAIARIWFNKSSYGGDHV